MTEKAFYKQHAIQSIPIFDIDVGAFTSDGLFDAIHELVQQNGRTLVTYVNIHTINTLLVSASLREAYAKSAIVYCDGAGVVWGAKVLGEHLPGRLTSASFIYDFCKKWEQDHTSIFFLGGGPNVAQIATSNLISQFPQLRICGHHHGYFRLGSEEESSVIQRINDAKPDILFVGFGTPKQEEWVLRHFDQLDAKVIWPIGALVDYVSGQVPRCPNWMQQNSLEWLFRLHLEPMRMFKRYVIGNPLFMARVLMERFKQK